MTIFESESLVEAFSRAHQEDMSRLQRAVADERESWEMRLKWAGKDLMNSANEIRRWAQHVDGKFLREMLELHAQFVQDRAEAMLAGRTCK